MLVLYRKSCLKSINSFFKNELNDFFSALDSFHIFDLTDEDDNSSFYELKKQ